VPGDERSARRGSPRPTIVLHLRDPSEYPLREDSVFLQEREQHSEDHAGVGLGIESELLEKPML
jgi:hypothetical protein